VALFSEALQQARTEALQRDERVVQIMPAPDWFIVFNDEEYGRVTAPVVGWGITAEGEVVALVADREKGIAYPIRSREDFDRLDYAGEVPDCSPGSSWRTRTSERPPAHGSQAGGRFAPEH